jgi:hypothetical protein
VFRRKVLERFVYAWFTNVLKMEVADSTETLVKLFVSIYTASHVRRDVTAGNW